MFKVLRKGTVWAAEVAKAATVLLPLRKQDTMPNLAEAEGEAARTQHRTTLAQVARPYLPQVVAAEEKRTVLTVVLAVLGVGSHLILIPQAVAGQVPHQGTAEMVRPEVMDAVTVAAGPKSHQETLVAMVARQVEVEAAEGTMATVAREPEAKLDSIVGR